jgi:fucose permease
MKYVIPVLMAFFVASFCDMVGIGVDRVKLEFNLSNTLSQLIPMAVFLWFFVLSVPVGIAQDNIGKRNMLIIGMGVTVLGLLLPFLVYSFATVLVGFALLGIGNTIIQVSANPLLVEVVPASRRSSFLSFSQFIKSIGSMIAPPLAGWFALQLGDWKILFLVFGVVSLINALWLWAVRIEETVHADTPASFASSLQLLNNRFVAFMVLCIFLVVGIDVGINAISGQFLLSKFDTEQMLAESGRSLYFFGKMLGTFAGALLLTKIPSGRFYLWSSVLALIAIAALMVMPTEFLALTTIFIIGLTVANIFPLIFSITVGRYPSRANEISGLMIMAISGGAVIPFLMGWISDTAGVTASIFVLVAAIVIILVNALATRNSEIQQSE